MDAKVKLELVKRMYENLINHRITIINYWKNYNRTIVVFYFFKDGSLSGLCRLNRFFDPVYLD